MEKLINGILVYSSLDDEEVELYDIDLNILIDEILAMLHVPEHISINIINKLPVIRGDKFRLLRLFQSLIHNAILYNDKAKGEIEISCQDTGRYWKFCIDDNGKGIEEKYLEKIFKIFQKLDNDLTSTGVGLSIVKKIIEIYRGNIYAESELGKGTKIYFSLKKF